MEARNKRIHAFRTDALDRDDATAMAARLRAGKVSSKELHEAARNRLHLLNSHLNALVRETPELSTKQLDRVARQSPANAPDAGLFAGIPFVIKDNNILQGIITRHGSAATPDNAPGKSSPYINSLLQMGLIPLGISNMSEFGLTPTTESKLYGAACNPWHPAHSTGGSSGGSAALVSSGVVPLANANDGGGSIRIPASCCGLVGLKPSRGRHPADQVHKSLPVNIVSQGIVSRSVRDTANFWRAYEQIFPARNLPPIGKIEGPGSNRLRIAFFTGSLPDLQLKTHPELKRITLKTATLCDELGHYIEEIPFPYTRQFFDDFLNYWAMLAYLADKSGSLIPGFRAGNLENFTKGLSSHFSRNKLKSLQSVLRLRNYQTEYQKLFKEYDIIMHPTISMPPPELGYLNVELPFEQAIQRLESMVSATPVQNIAGAPGISLPMGQTQKGLPVGIHFAAPVAGEQTLLELSFALESAQPFRLNE